eukprot:488063-Prymnesium_polylepis.3
MAEDRRRPAKQLRIARPDAVPQTPDILPRDEADAVEEGRQDVAHVIGCPAVAHVRHVARLEQAQL